MKIYIEILSALWIYATIWFIISIFTKRNDIADIAWGLGYVLVCGYLLIFYSPSLLTQIAYLLILIWAVRLSIHIYIRNKGKMEDFRYRKWREEWGSSFFIRSYLQVFLFQALLLFVIISPAVNSTLDPNIEFTWLSVLAIFGWIVGFLWQLIGDMQLANFVKTRTSKEEIITSGLWKYSRHPNYFGEVVMWWSIYLLLLPSDNSLYFIIGPLMITMLIRYVSGVPMLEARYKNNAAYQQYKKSVPALVPKLIFGRIKA